MAVLGFHDVPWSIHGRFRVVCSPGGWINAQNLGRFSKLWHQFFWNRESQLSELVHNSLLSKSQIGGWTPVISSSRNARCARLVLAAWQREALGIRVELVPQPVNENSYVLCCADLHQSRTAVNDLSKRWRVSWIFKVYSQSLRMFMDISRGCTRCTFVNYGNAHKNIAEQKHGIILCFL